MLYNEDCLSALSGMSAESVDLIYLDPPFFSQKNTACSMRRGACMSSMIYGIPGKSTFPS